MSLEEAWNSIFVKKGKDVMFKALDTLHMAITMF
jgi:hypothetical protein